ncbi:MAG: dipeptidase [Parafilimonas sp.]|nr:dipeptidase [Parafilimonas sp.]
MISAQKTLNELSELIGFASVSSNDTQAQAIYNCAEWLVNHFKYIGIEHAGLYKTSSHPVVFAHHIIDPALPTILFYGHYDVQPADPVNKWHTRPFKAVIKGEYIYGRGASDDKGQMFIHIKAVEKLLRQKQLPVNVKFLIEGAEEIGSLGLKDFITINKNLLHCDAVVVSDTKMVSLKKPAITYSLRGSLNAELFISTGKKDLHSGTFGGYVPNAAIELSKFINKLYNSDHSIAITGFYDDVEKVSDEKRRFIKVNGVSDEKLLNDAEVFTAWGEKNYSLHERSTIRPSLSVTGITSGFQGKGVKNVIPSVASVKLNFRLVHNQKPEAVKRLFDDYARRMLTNTTVKTVYSSFNNPVTVAVSSPYIKAAATACENVFKNKPGFIQNGGTIGAVDYLNSILKVPVVLMGFAQASDNMHAPDEKFYLPNFFRGIDTIIKFIQNVALLNNKKHLHEAAYY